MKTINCQNLHTNVRSNSAPSRHGWRGGCRWLLAALALLLGCEAAFADEFYFTRVRALADAEEGATGLFMWDDVTGAQSQIGGNGAVYLRHATDGPMAVGGIATNSAGTLYGFALDDTVTPNFLPLGTSTGSWDCPATLRSRLVTIDTNTAEITYVGPYLPGRAPLAAAFDGTDRLWGYDCVTKEVVQIDPSTGGVIGTPIATGITAAVASGLDFAANGLGIIGFNAFQFLSFDPDSGSVANVPISAQNSGFDGGLPNPYAIVGVAFTGHLAARNGSPAAEDCRLNLQEHRGLDELGHANDPFFANPVTAFREAEALNPASVSPSWFNGGPGDIARVGGPALPNCFYDWGDAPAGYGTLGADNGPRHAIVAPGPYLGAGLPDFETDGQPGPATDDDNTGTGDEDGVFVPTLTRGATMQIEVEAGGDSADTRLQAWIDWDGDGGFAQPDDQIITDAAVVAGVNTFNVDVPADAVVGTTYARFRIADESGLGFLGLADSGEVEDHAVLITAGEPLLTKAFADSSIPYGGGTALVFTIDNSAAGGADQSGIGFTDNLPVGLMIADPANIVSDCSGATVTADAGTSTIVVSDAGLLAGQSCTISVDVTNRPGYTGVCYDPNFANENQNITGLNNLAAAIAQFTCLSVDPPDCPDADLTNGFDNVSGLSPNLNNGVSNQCVALTPTLELIKISEEETGTFEFTLSNTDAVNPVVITTTAPGVPGTSGGVFNVVDMEQPVTVTESGLPLDWELFEIACDDDSGDPLGSFDSATATWTAAPGELFPGQQIVCTVINRPPEYFDFGDAPESYGTLLIDDGARHLILNYDDSNFTSSLMLGASVDDEPDGFPSAGAAGDDNDGIDDEDAFGVMPPIDINLPEYTVDVPVLNATGADADLVAWIDFNRNGQFDIDEAATAVVADGQTTATLTWTGLSLGGQFGSTYARLRIAPAGEIDADSPTGEAAGGEVEDYTVSFVDLPGPPFSECPVNEEPPPTNFTIQERWSTPDVAGQRTLAYQTPVAGDLYGTGQIVAVVGADNGFDTSGGTVPTRLAKDLHIVNGVDGTVIDTVVTPHFGWSGHAAMAIADITGDGQGEIILKASHSTLVPAAQRGRLIAYLNDGTVLWVSDQRYDYGDNTNGRGGAALGFADFDGDGVPEVYVGTQIFDAATGTRLAAATAADSAGCPYRSTVGCFWGQSTAVDMDDDGQLELVAGNVVYKVDLDEPDPALRLTVWQQADGSVTGVGDGWTAVADIDLDGTPDVVVVRTNNQQSNGNTVLYVWDGQTSMVKSVVTGIGIGGGAPLLGDIDGDGNAEIVMVNQLTLRAFDFDPGTGLVSKWTISTNDGSALTSLAMFDFNNDGSMELVYRDQDNIRIIDGSGATAVDLAFFACTSGTATEMPVVAALDGTRQARILVTCGTVGNGNVQGVLRTFETASFPWANTRPVWNQQAYFVAHINDDLSVPSNQFPHWTAFNDPGQQCSDGVNRPLNAFQQQVTDLDPANGCPVVCTPPIVETSKALTNESGDIDGEAEAGELLTYTVTLTNVGGIDADDWLVVDHLDANVVFVSADMGGVHDGAATGGTVEWDGLFVPADDFIELTVTVQVVDPIPDGVLEIRNVAYNPVTEPPPDCDEDPLPPNCTITPTPEVHYDFGDAPESYGTLLIDDGARHVILDYDADNFTSSLVLGAAIDDEPDGFPSTGADGDDLDILDDEDAFGVMPPININLPEYTIDVPVHNATGADADLVAWVDFDRNGQFDIDEAATAVVADGQTMATLTWTGLSLAGQFGGTYARLRIAPAGGIDIDMPTGLAQGGEVEDYTVPFVDLPPPFVECPVSEEPPPVDFTIQERWRTPNTAGQRTLPYQTPVVGDLYGTGQIVAVVGSDNNFVGFGSGQPAVSASDLHIIRGTNGALLDTIATPRFNWFGHSVVAIADVDGDGVSEVFLKAGHYDEMAAANRGRLFAYKYDGTSWNQWWVSDVRYDYGNDNANTNNTRRSGHALSIADFNGDGIPEIFIGSQIFNAQTGVRLAARPAADPAGCALAACIQGSTVAVDMDGDGQLELVAGNVVYKVDITNTGGAAGNSMTIWRQADAVAAMGDGFTSVADIDLDGDPDVVIVRAAGGTNDNNAHLFVWDGQTGDVLGAIHAGQLGISGSQPLIGDIDGDDIPEIVFVTANQLNAYKYEPGTGLVAKWNTTTSDASGQTSFALFDFNSNGRKELVYRDETDLRILDGSGANAVDLATFPCFSGTRAEMPVVAALDGSQEARILVTCSVTDTFDGNARGSLRTYETASFPWANTRPVWNQQAYFVAHINDDLSVPANQFPHWTAFNDPGQQCSDGVNRPLNAFQQQVTDLDPTNGCPVVCAPVLIENDKQLTAESGEIDGEAEAGELLTYTITLTNVGGVDADNHGQIDQLDPNVVFVSADNGGVHDGSATGGDVEWTGLFIPADDFLELTITVQVLDPIPDGVLEIGNVTYDPSEGPPDCDDDPIPPNCTITITEPNVSDGKDLVAESGAVDGEAEAGEQLTYEITLTNTGGADAENHVQIDQLDPNVIFISADTGGVHDGSATGGDVTWDVTVPAADDLGPGVLVLTVVVQVVDPIPDGVLAIGNVTYDPDEGPPDCDVVDPPPNCSDPLPTEPNVSDSKDLVAENGDTDGVAEAGEELTYEITLTNTGGVDAENHVQIDQLDPNVIFVSADNGGVHDGSATGGDVTWTVTVPADSVLVLTVVVQVVDPIPDGVLEIGNVTYDPDEGPPDCDVVDPPPNCSDPLPTEPNVSDGKDLVAESGAVDGVAEAGEQLTYEITLTNTGGSDAVNHVQIDQLDPNVIFVSADNGGVHDGSATGGDVTWTVTVPADGVLVLTVVVQVVDPIPDGVTEIGNVTYNPDDGPPDCDVVDPPPNCSDPLPTEPNVFDSKDLVAESGAVDGVAEAGEQLTYEITLTNTGGSDAENHVQIDQLDPNVIFVSADNGGVHDGAVTGGEVTWTVTVPADDVLVLTVLVQVVDPIPDGVLAIGNVTYNPDIGPPDCDVVDPPPNCTEIPTEPNTRVEKSIIAESGGMDGIAEPGEVLTYGIRVYNTGGADALNVEVNEMVPDHATYVADGSDAWNCANGSAAGTPCDFIIAAVPGGGFVDLLFRVQIVDPIPPDVTAIANSVALDGEPPPQCPPDTDPACVVIPTEPQTVISKALTDESGQYGGQIEAGEILTYTITVTNHGGTDDTDVEVNEIVPDHTATATGNQNANGALGAWSCADGSGPGTACDLVLPVVESGQTITLEFIIQVDDPIPDGVETIANCAGLNGEIPPNPSPQCVTLPTEPSVSVVKTLFMEDGEIDGAAEAGEILVYELTVVNSGGSTAFDEFLREIVPQHTTFVADPVSSPDWDCPDNSPNPTVCDLFFDIDAGETLSFLFAVQVVDPLPDGVTQIANGIGHGGNPPPCPPGGVHCVVIPTVNLATDKNIVSVTPFGANAYEVRYEITVTNTGGADNIYTLFDELGYPADGVILLDPALAATDDGVLEPDIAANNGQFTPVNNTPVQLSDIDVPLPVGAAHIYTVAIRIAVDPGQVKEPDCTGAPGDGLFNQAMVIGDADADDDACAPVPTDEPRVGLVKRNRLIDANGNGYGDVKEDLEYTFEIANSGNVELSSLRLIDAKVRPPQGAWVKCDAPGTPGNGSYVFDDPLAAGESITCTALYTLSQNDVDNRRVTNTATVVGFAPDGRQVRASHTSIFENFQGFGGGK